MRFRITIGILGMLLITTAFAFVPKLQADEACCPIGANIAAHNQHVQMTRHAVEILQRNIDTFRFELSYHGPDPKTYHTLHMSVDANDQKLRPSSIHISKEQANLIIGCLARDGALYRGSINREKLLMQPMEPYYLLYVQGGDRDAFFEHIPWGNKPYKWHGVERPPILEQINGLRGVLLNEAAKTIDALVKPIEAASQKEHNKPDAIDGK